MEILQKSKKTFRNISKAVDILLRMPKMLLSYWKNSNKCSYPTQKL